MTLLQIIDDKKQITGKKSIITACNVDYRLKRSGPSRIWKYSEEVTKTDQLVVIVGSTGTGKSTLIEIMTGQDVETSGGAKSVTRQCQLINSPDSLYYWLDSVGWEDR